MKYTNLPLLQICVVFILGVWFGFTLFETSLSTSILISFSLFILFIGTFFTAKYYPESKLMFTLAALAFIFSLGSLNTSLHLTKHQNHHFSQFTFSDSTAKTPVAFEGEVVKPLKSNAFTDKFEVELHSINTEKVNGKVLLQLPAIERITIEPNAKISGLGYISTFKESPNPQQFNYKAYMATQQMSHVINSDSTQIQVRPQLKFSFIGFGESARDKIKQSLKPYEFTKSQMDIIQALLLGQKQDIDPETYNRFSQAGVVHILAVSGLHVGIILLLLQFITKGLLHLKYGRILRSGIVLLGIWGFATLAGYTPSVLRAAVMFSFLSFALTYRRKTSAINTLALSAVFLMLINPYFIHQVGFQLSYLAVISIVILQPRLARVYQPKTLIDQKIWDIITVTFTAQLGVLPLSLYYFHQFPGLFLLSNLIILPGLGVLLGGGIIVICLSLLGLLPELLASAYGILLDVLLDLVEWIASKEDFVFSDIYFTKPMLVFCMVLFFSLIVWDSGKKVRSYFILNVSLLALLICFHIEKRKQLQQEEFIIFQSYRNSELGILKGSQLKVFSDQYQNRDAIEASYHIKNYKVLKGINSLTTEEFRPFYDLSLKDKLYVVDSSAVYPKQDFQSNLILLKNSPNVNLERLIQDLKPKQIIADGSNYRTDIERWKSSAKKFSVKFHSTWEDGAYVYSED